MDSKLKIWITDVDGDKYHLVDNALHNDDDEPAIIRSNGTKVWYKNGLPHREIGAAIEFYDGTKCWFYNGVRLGQSWQGYIQEDFKAWKRFKAFI